jgi:hypothetical protein
LAFGFEEEIITQEEQQNKEKKSITKQTVKKAEAESAVFAAIAAMEAPYHAMGERLHAIIKASEPVLSPRLWYGMPA